MAFQKFSISDLLFVELLSFLLHSGFGSRILDSQDWEFGGFQSSLCSKLRWCDPLQGDHNNRPAPEFAEMMDSTFYGFQIEPKW